MKEDVISQTLDQLNMIIRPELLESICKHTIETILLCLDHATEGTIYRIGPMPGLQAVRITSGVREEENGKIHWGLHKVSDYDFPGKSWEQYRDEPGRVLEAMGWCVEKQKSWTSDNPYEDPRSVRKQLYGEAEDFHHMEPVLVSKQDLYGNRLYSLQYALDWHGNPIWQDTDYVVVAVIKIHFLHYTIRRGDRATKVIKKLSQTLGTEMLSLHLRESLLRGQKELARQRLESCNILAHELRNTLMKLSFAFKAIDTEIGFLRDQWEMELRKAYPEFEDKRVLLERLSELVRLRIPRMDGPEELTQLAKRLLAEEKQLAMLSLLPHEEEQWINEKIQPKWDRLLVESQAWYADRKEVCQLLERLRKAIWMGMDAELAKGLTHLPEDLRTKWPELVYSRFSAENLPLVDKILQLLHHPAFAIPHKHHTLRMFTYLRALVKAIPEMEARTNTIVSYLKTGIMAEEYKGA